VFSVVNSFSTEHTEAEDEKEVNKFFTMHQDFCGSFYCLEFIASQSLIVYNNPLSVTGESMKIIAITSSPSQEGNTALLARESLEAAHKLNIEVKEIWLPGENLKFCQGCMSCMASICCPLPDSLETIKEEIRSADGIILASPTYGLATNAIMKNFLDRIGMYAVYTGCYGGKYIAGIATAGGFGAGRVAKKLKTSLGSFFGRQYEVGHLGIHVGWQKITEYPKALKKAQQLGGEMAIAIQKKKTYPLQHILKRILETIIIKPIFKKNIRINKDMRMKAVYNYLHEQGKI